jgi:hypothetical protein
MVSVTSSSHTTSTPYDCSSHENAGQNSGTFVSFLCNCPNRTTQTERVVLLMMIREEKIEPTGRARKFVSNETQARYHQTIGSTGRGCTRACRTTIRLFGGREARWMRFTLNAGTSRLLSQTVTYRSSSKKAPFHSDRLREINAILHHLTNGNSFLSIH